MKRIFPILFVVAAALVGCGKDDAYDFGQFYNDMVTFTGSDNGTARFENIGRGGEKSVLYAKIDTKSLQQGRRVLLNYVVAENLGKDSYNVDVHGIVGAVTDTVRSGSDVDVKQRRMEQIKLRSIWRTGDYINIHCEVEYTEKARTLCVLATKSSMSTNVADCYLVHDTKGAQKFFWRTCYFSVYVGDTFGRCDEINLHINDAINPDKKVYNFKK